MQSNKAAKRGTLEGEHMVYNISDVGGESDGGGIGSVNIWSFNLTKGDGVTTAGGQFVETSEGGRAVPDPPPEVTYEFSELQGDTFGAVTLDVAGSSNTTGLYSFTVDFKAIPPGAFPTTITFTVTGSRPNTEGGGGTVSDTDTIEIELLICVARGTAIATPDGPRPVQSLKTGDLVHLADGRDEPIRWIGSRVLTKTDLAEHPDLRPIRIAAHAYGPDRPNRDLLVSPQHRINVTGWQAELLFGMDDMLAPAKGLVNDRTITIATDVEQIEYFHLLFARHEIMLTNNLETESFFPGDTSLKGIDEDAREEVLTLFPELADPNETTFTLARPGLKAWEARLVETVTTARQ